MRQRENFSQILIRHAKALAGIIGLVIAIISLYALWQGEEWRSKYIGLAVLNGFYFIVILYLTWLLLTQKNPDFLGVPKVRVLIEGGLILVEHSPWLSVGVMAAIYIIRDDVERLICVGEVVNVQSNGLIQIQVRQANSGYDSERVWEMLTQVNKEHILVKPGLYLRTAV